jgi:hypothetical protein
VEQLGWGDEKLIQKLSLKTCMEEAIWENRRRWKENITNSLKGIVFKGVDWIHLAHSRVQWRAIVNTLIDLRV